MEGPDAVAPFKEKTLMTDLTSPRTIYAKAFLFVVGGLLAGLLLLWERPTMKVGLLLFLAIWCFARAYYFVFYVIEHYVDSDYKFSGLWSFARYVLRHRFQAERRESWRTQPMEHATRLSEREDV